ncbi:MAG: hypothetical protein IPJ65_04655 [Archangiaceae bacterium]|nr:hypothetical protein [Archangiaceae bacterium]
MKRAARALLLSGALAASRALAVDAQYDLAGRVDVRIRSATAGDVGKYVTGDLELLPSAGLMLASTTTSFAALYNPSILFREPQTLGPVAVLHRLRLGLTQRWHRTTFTLTEDAAYGESDVTALRSPEGAQPGQVGDYYTVGVVPYVRTATTLLLERQLTRRSSFLLTAGYNVSGSPQNTVALPLQWGPYGSARLSLRATHHDVLSTVAQVTQATFTTGQEQLIAQLYEVWDAALTRQTSGSITLGAAYTREKIVAMVNGPPPGTYSELLPVAGLSLSMHTRQSELPVDFTASVRLSPFADRFTGAVYERLEGRVQADVRPNRKVALMAATGSAVAVALGRNDPAGDKLVFVESSVSWVPHSWITVAVLGRMLWVDQPRVGIRGQVQGLAICSVTVREQDSAGW